MTTARYLIAYLKYYLTLLAIRVGYLIRPYDMLADRRRWAWQEPQHCLPPYVAQWGTCRLNNTPHWCMGAADEAARRRRSA